MNSLWARLERGRDFNKHQTTQRNATQQHKQEIKATRWPCQISAKNAKIARRKYATKK